MEKPKFIDHGDVIDGLVEVKLDRFTDHRGYNFEGYNRDVYEDCPFWPQFDFVIDSYSTSHKDVLRGFHGDSINWKLIQCIFGEIEFFVIDMREDSSTYNNALDWKLNDTNPTQILIPPGCVNAHSCLSDKCVFMYKLSNNYAKQEDQIHVKWNSPKYNLNWKVKNPILSGRDK